MKRVGLGLAAAVSLLGPGIGPAGAADDADTEMIVAGRPVPEGKYVFQVRLYDSGDDSVGIPRTRTSSVSCRSSCRPRTCATGSTFRESCMRSMSR